MSVVVASLMKVPLAVGPVEKKLPNEKYWRGTTEAATAGIKVAHTEYFIVKEL